MDKTSSEIYRKTFTSRYELSREHQILEYLGQRHAPVPPVVLSHVEMAYLEMHHGGTDLHQWLNSGSVTPAEAMQALAGALSALIVTAQLDVWHIDIALRNFVIQNTLSASERRVWLIDFGNAICPHFALQKPLWMLPNRDQHPLLQTALAQDWQDFYKRHQLSEPPDWHAPFDVPQHIYQEDWTRGLHVEDMPLKWCVTAHGAAQMLLLASRMHPSLLAEFKDAFLGLLNLQNEEDARALLQQCLGRLQHACVTPKPIHDAKTPRPRAQPPSQVPTPITNLTRSEGVMTAPTFPKPAPMETTSHHGWILGISAIFLGIGWWILDIGYNVQRQTISWLTLTTLLFVLVFSLIGLAGLLKRQNKMYWLVCSMWLHGFGQFTLLFELWVFGMPLSSLGWLGLAPTLALLGLAWRSVTHQHHPTPH